MKSVKNNFRKCRKYILQCSVIFLCIYICAISLCGCVDPLRHKSKLEWRAKKNDYGIELTFANLRFKDSNSSTYGYIKYKDKCVEINFQTIILGFYLGAVSYYGEDISNFLYRDQALEDDSIVFRYISGSYDILTNNIIVLSFGTDYLFDGELNGIKIIISSHRVVDPTAYGIGRDHHVEWKNSEENIFLTTLWRMKNFSLGMYKDRKVMTIWQKDNKFKMYEIVDGVQQTDVLCYGSYIYTGESVTLCFEKNDIFESKEIVFNACRDYLSSVHELYPTADGDVVG